MKTQSSIKPELHIVWLKRDLRLKDNEAIFNAIYSGKKVLLLYCFEDFLLNDRHYSKRHWDFVKQSIEDINNNLKGFNSKTLAVNSTITSAVKTLQQYYTISNIYSHKETGLLSTFKRDINFASFCKTQKIIWTENENNGVQRGIKNRKTWFKDWGKFMEQPQFSFAPKDNQLLKIQSITKLEKEFEPINLATTLSKTFQKGGTSTGLKYLSSFLKERHKSYMFNISKPLDARSSCSRLSPYIAWGNLSIKQVLDITIPLVKKSNYKRHLNAFISRLRWQSHFIQKFEMEHSMEFKSVNKGYHNLQKQKNEAFQNAWKKGQTGFPLVDACMRCLNETGYLNFRMRAMVVSFFVHNLWQPWQDLSEHLASLFLDFEPGIHYPQIQMQAGETGINNLRIYNATKNSIEYDPDAVFIKKWVPELKVLEPPYIHEPTTLPYFDQQLLGFEIGKDYPLPIINEKESRKKASDILWAMKNNPLVKQDNNRILKRHTITDRTRMLRP